jgi:hypothetical protein
MEVAALVVAIVSAVGSVYAVWYARVQARLAARSAAAAGKAAAAGERSAISSEATAALETRRRRAELTPARRRARDRVLLRIRLCGCVGGQPGSVDFQAP